MRLALIHRPRAALQSTSRSTTWRSRSNTWRTCLREVQFVDDPHGLFSDEMVLRDEAAYGLLLEIVCGLRSPLIGETEVHAQFKVFIATLDPVVDGWLRGVGERVLADAKLIRHRYLQGFGAHSYGRLAARRITGERVALVGTGALAGQVLASVPAGMTVDVWGRRPSDLSGRDGRPVRAFLLADARAPRTPEPGATTVVVAAPVGECDLNAIVARYGRVVRLVDLRAADQQTPVDRRIPVTELSRLLAEASSASGSPATAARHAAAVAEVRRRARAFAAREELRPFGWEDLCA